MSRIENNNVANINSLDGFTILRFTHTYESGGGIEQYVDDLDRMLLNRNKLTILRMYLSKDIQNTKERIEKIGQGTLIKIPLSIRQSVLQIVIDSQKTEESYGSILKNLFRDWVIYNPIFYRIIFHKILKRLSSSSCTIEVQNAKQEAERLFKNFKIDLLIMHYTGGADSGAIINVAKSFNIPYIYLNHFSNDRFNHMSIREQITDAAGRAGVSSVDVPRRLKNKFFNLSDGIDTEMFMPNNGHSMKMNLNIGANIVILPARIVSTKGQSDLIKACAMLKKQELHIKVVLAGRSDSLLYEEQLKKQTRELNIIDDILFVGQLNREQLRDWYGVSAVLAFPTYHHEGLPRILMEAQAMEVPPVAYNIGGISEGIQQGKTGFIIPKGDLKLFTEKLRELLIDENKRKKMGKEGRRFVQECFSLEALARRHEQYYLRIIRNTKQGQ